LKPYQSLEFWLTFTILCVTVTASILAYIFWYNLLFFVGPYLFIHWLGITATTFIIFSTPIYYVLKRKKPQNSKFILRIHVFGNLMAFLLISLHFAQNVGRLAGAPERLGNGVLLYWVLFFIMLTGIIEKFPTNRKLAKFSRITHRYSVILLYLAVLIHVLDGLNIINFFI
jgi:hypothetical protein